MLTAKEEMIRNAATSQPVQCPQKTTLDEFFDNSKIYIECPAGIRPDIVKVLGMSEAVKRFNIISARVTNPHDRRNPYEILVIEIELDPEAVMPAEVPTDPIPPDVYYDPIPPDVYYHVQHDNFYGVGSGKGLGIEFYAQWKHRKEEFPDHDYTLPK